MKIKRQKKQNSLETKYKAILLLKDGVNIRKIAKKYNITTRAIHRWKNRIKTGSVSRKKGSGRKRKLNSQHMLELEKIFEENRTLSSRKLTPKIENILQSSLSSRTVRLYRQRMRWKGVHPRTIPFLTELHKKKRMTFAQIYSNYSFRYVVFTDESKIDIFRNTSLVFKKVDDKRPNKKKRNSNISVMVWGGISWQGKTKLAFAKDFYKNSSSRMNSQVYTTILNQYLFPFTEKTAPDGWWKLLQDNAPIHKSKMTMNFLKQHHVNVIDFPPNSPDMNPIEKVWNELKRLVELQNPQTKEELIKSIKLSWSKITQKTIRKQIRHLSKVLEKVMKNNGEFSE